MNFTDFMGRHSRSIVVAALAVALAGLAAAFSLPVGLFPQVAFPRVVVDLDAGNRPADQTVLLLARPVEEAIRTVPGVLNLRSATTRGTSQISIDFGWGRDMIASTLLVDAAIAQVLPTLPAGTAYTVRRMDPTVFPILSYALQSDRKSPVELRDLAQFRIVPLLSSIAGLARVDVQGGNTAEVEVAADVHRLAAYGLGLSDLATTLNAGNVLTAVGQLQDRSKLFLVLAGHSVRNAAGIGDLVVRADPRGVVRVRDVARVSDGVVPLWVKVLEDGKPAVLFNVYEQPDGNAVSIAAAVRNALHGFAMPAGVKLTNWYDQSDLVTKAATSVRDAVLIGLVLAAVVLMVFLRNWRMTAIAVAIVPATLAGTMLLLSLLGMSFNIMTLGGIAAAVGLLVDDVIVMLEHIARRAGGAFGGAATVLPAAREFLTPLTGSSLATLIVFVPLSFLSGVTGSFSKALSLTMGGALAFSYLMTAFVVPVLARRTIDFSRWHDPVAAGEGRLGRSHTWLLDRALARPWVLLVPLVVLLGVGYLAYAAVPTGFMPAVDEGGFVMDYYSKPGTSLTETEREIEQADKIVAAMPETATFSRRLGTGLGGDLAESYHGDYFVRLKSDRARPTDEVMADVLAQVQAQVPGLEIDLAQRMEDLIGDLTAVPQPIEIKLYAADTATLIPQARRIAEAIGHVAGVVEVQSGVRLAGDAIDLRIDPVRAGLEGTTPADVTQAVSDALTGNVATQLPQTAKSVGVRLSIPGARALNTEQLADLPIRAADGHIFPLHRVAEFATITGQPEITRDNLQPMVAVTGRIESRGIGAAIADVRDVLARPGMLAPGTRYEFGGLYKQQQIAFAGLSRVFVAALIAELALLLFLYERFWLPVIIIGCSLLSTTAVFGALWLTGVPLNITAIMGMTMIIGIGTEMAIFYVSEFTELEHIMPAHEAVREASRNRLRPITMTTLAAILTLLPLALAIGQGSGIQQPLAIAIIAGLLLQYPLVLVAMPVLVRFTLARPGALPLDPVKGHAL